MRLLTLAAAALAALLLTIALANAQEPPETQTVTRLEPGVNLVGWVGEPASTSQLFDEIPQLESIWAWDAELDDWVAAGRDAPERSSGLRRVAAGMGLGLVLGGDQPFTWERSTEPTRGLVELRTGWNLVAWSGANGAPLEQVGKGIGWSLRELRRWDAASQSWTTWTSPERSAQLIAASATDQGATDEEAEPVTVRRGEALWVNVARAVNWLQPTDILPRLVFPGGASDELQARVREDLEAVLSFYGQQYGIQADSNFTIYVAKDVEALIQAYKDDGEESYQGWEGLRALWNSAGGWAGGKIVVKQTSWPEDLSTSDISRARYTLTHEYFHVLQEQLSHLQASQWLVEGTAYWAEDEHQVLDGEQTLEALRERELSELSPRTPTLRSAEQDNAQWEYTLGWLAIDRLTATAGGGSHIEFWRRLAPTEIGPHGRWISTPDWRTAFQETFGVPVSSFYADFNAWQRGQAAANGVPESSGDDDARWIRGRITDEGGAPVAGVFVNAIRVEGETSVGWNQRAETDADGAFAVRAPEGGDYRISVDIADNCTPYYSDGGLTKELGGAQPVTVAGSDVQGVNIQLAANICGWQIRGQVVNTAGQPLVGISVSACPSSQWWFCGWSDSTSLNGSFAVSPRTAGEYRLRLALADDCEVYFQDRRVVLSSSDASLVTVAGADVDGLTLRLPDSVCAHKITGSVTKADGQPLANTYIDVVREVNGRKVGRAFGQNTGIDGSFAITAPGEAAYNVSFSLGGCWLYFSAGGITPDWDQRLLARVSDRDLQLGPRQIPAELCAHRISGRVVDANGAPLVDKSVHVCRTSACAQVLTTTGGRFTIRVPRDDSYRFVVSLTDDCNRRPEGRALGSRNNPVRVSGADVTGMELRLPGTIEELCG